MYKMSKMSLKFKQITIICLGLYPNKLLTVKFGQFCLSATKP